MKKYLIIIALVCIANHVNAQFHLKMKLKNNLHKEAYVFGYNGSKEFILTKATPLKDIWDINITSAYKGVMRIYFPSNSEAFTCISENKDIVMQADSDINGRFTNVTLLDIYNKSFLELQNHDEKLNKILPVLQNLIMFYPNTNTNLRRALDQEIMQISVNVKPIDDALFTQFYFLLQNKYLKEKASNNHPNSKILQQDILKLLSSSDDRLETSTLLKPLLVQYLSFSNTKSLEQDVDDLIVKVDIHTSRGQNVLSELLNVFQTYEITELHNKYIKEAKALTCTINDRLQSTLAKAENFKIGATLPDYSFVLSQNKAMKSIHNVKAKNKIIMFWSSTCSHCLAEFPEIIQNYLQLKKQDVEIIGISLDTNRIFFDKIATTLPWINDTELKGWYSSFMEKFDILATPTFVILDENNVILNKPSKFPDVLEYLKKK